jgi:hypothetical protein
MTERARPLIAIDDEYGRPVAAADIELVDPVLARASLHVEAGHVPMGTRGRLVDAVLDSPEIRSRQWIQVALPLGDTEMLNRVRERCTGAQARAAGATCLIDVTFPQPGPASG